MSGVMEHAYFESLARDVGRWRYFFIYRAGARFAEALASHTIFAGALADSRMGAPTRLDRVTPRTANGRDCLEHGRLHRQVGRLLVFKDMAKGTERPDVFWTLGEYIHHCAWIEHWRPWKRSHTDAASLIRIFPHVGRQQFSAFSSYPRTSQAR
jgi:hypothetical protein